MTVLTGAATDDELVEQARERRPQPLVARDRATSVAIGGSFLATAVTMAALLPTHESSTPLVAVALVALYAFVSRIEFELGPGSAVPSQLVLVPMLFALPASLVPLFVAAGYLLGGLVDHATGRIHPQRAFVLLAYSWHSVGPALVIALLTDGHARWSDWPIYALALGAQFAFDLVSSALREWLAFGVSPLTLLPYLASAYGVDALLAPVALAVAIAAEASSVSIGIVLPLAALLALLASDRRRRIDRALAVNEAYEGATREARSDPLTNVANRRAWDEAVASLDARGAAAPPVSVLVVDLDGLKLANDTRGHEFGDQLLCTLARLVRESVRDRDLVARIGGDEFAVLMPDTDAEECVRTAARLEGALALHAEHEGFPLAAAVGHAACPPAASVAEAQRAADLTMYARKAGRSGPPFSVDNIVVLPRAARREPATAAPGGDTGIADAPPQPDEACGVLLSVLHEFDATLDDHVRDVAMLAAAVGERLGMSADELDELTVAAAFHDIGKLAVPDAIVRKPGPLTAEEWAVMRRHPVVGGRIASRAASLQPVAQLVRASHERYDGEGYPDGLAGDEIPLASRIIAVCDAYHAMISERPYKRAMPHALAVAELRAWAGTQFDPRVVEAFVAAVPGETAARAVLGAR